jgi:hypothetical protein
MNQLVQVILGIVAGIFLILILMLFGLTLDDVFGRNHLTVETPYGSYAVGEERMLFKPLLWLHVLLVPAVWRLCTRVGYPGWFGLAMLIPFGNVLLLFFLGFAEWPIRMRDQDAAGQRRDDTVVSKPMPMARKDGPATM